MNNIILCYVDNNGHPSYAQMPFTSIENWKSENPGCTVTYLFDTDKDLQDRQNTLAESYRHACRNYGLEPEWLGQVMTDKNGRRLQIMGLKSSNPKYKILVRCLDDGRDYKISARSLIALAQKAGVCHG